MVYSSFVDEVPLGEECAANEFQAAAKDADEINRFTVDESLGDAERILLFLSGGHLIQQICAFRRIPVFLQSKRSQFTEAMQKALASVIPILDIEGQEQEPWMASIMELLPLLDTSALREIAAIALTKGSVEEDTLSRVQSCRLMGSMAEYMTSQDLGSIFLQKTASMCQDTDYEVRICMCQQIPALAAALGTNMSTDKLLPELLELLKDEEKSVQTTALETLLAICDFLPPQTLKATIMPIVKHYMQPLDLSIEVQKCVAKLFGPLLVKVSRVFDAENDGSLFFGCYRFLASRGENDLRQECARNFPGVVKTAGAHLYPVHFHNTFEQFSVDSDEEVRRIAAAQFHEVH